MYLIVHVLNIFGKIDGLTIESEVPEHTEPMGGGLPTNRKKVH